mmetsp:Transcript_120412/g.269172  ORF Transcript_120412/g.269172 Transcript_120412/m.269172 type:complete len:108 (-) Transcript_120412:29-352(-)
MCIARFAVVIPTSPQQRRREMVAPSFAGIGLLPPSTFFFAARYFIHGFVAGIIEHFVGFAAKVRGCRAAYSLWPRSVAAFSFAQESFASFAIQAGLVERVAAKRLGL